MRCDVGSRGYFCSQKRSRHGRIDNDGQQVSSVLSVVARADQSSLVSGMMLVAMMTN